MLARRLLSLPPFAVVAVYAVAFLLPEITKSFLAEPLQHALTSARALAGWLLAVTWAFALFLVAQRTLKSSAWIGRTIFAGALALLIALIPFVDALSEFGDPMWLLHSSMAFAFVSIGLAVNALLSAEGKNEWPFRFSWVLHVLALIFLPIGVWFLKSRVDKLLQQDVRVISAQR